MNYNQESGYLPQSELQKTDPVRVSIEGLVAVVRGHTHLGESRLDGFIVEGRRKNLFSFENRLHPIFSLANPFPSLPQKPLEESLRFLRYGSIDYEQWARGNFVENYYAPNRVFFTLNPDLQPVIIEKKALALDIYWQGADKDTLKKADSFPLYLINQYTPRIGNLFAFRNTAFLVENEILPVDTLIKRLGLDKTDTYATVAALSHYSGIK
jgi:hypothetical protein